MKKDGCSSPLKLTIRLSDITDCNFLTIKFEAELIQALDKDNKDITHLYAEQNEHKEPQKVQSNPTKPNLSIQNQLDSLIKTVSELSAKVDKMQERMDEIELRLNGAEIE